MTYPAYLSELTRDLPGELRVWISKGTRDLGRIGTVRVVEDIGSHYRKAIAVSETEGEEAAAKWKMLESLGDPGKARRRFRKIHLTVAQENRIRRSTILNASVRIRIYTSVVYIFFLSVYFVYFESVFAELHSITGLGWRLLGISALLVRSFVMDYLSHKSFYRREIRASVVQQSNSLWLTIPLVFLLLTSGIPGASYLDITATLGVATMVLSQWLGMMRIVRKLPKEISETELRLLQRRVLIVSEPSR